MAFYSAFLDAIPAFTGLSPAAFFTILALMIAVYHLVAGMFVSSDQLPDEKRTADQQEQQHVVSEPPQLGDVAEEELRAYDGSDPKKPLLMAIKGLVYDVTKSRMFYGPGGPYAMFAGKDASRALALMSFDPEDVIGNIEGLSRDELEVLQDWEYKFMEKYVKVGQITAKKKTEERSLEKTEGRTETENAIENLKAA
ncbi:membrane steroid-binding protein 2-like [Aristolochia californica]|uniref:membrane steroid-binding protein 2-like n=1 Tax=Aristolochia californica TaxID=171875 RepID=UPI0035E0230D